MSDYCTIGMSGIDYRGEKIADIDFDDELQMPVFKFYTTKIERTKSMDENQRIYLKTLKNEI